MSIGALRKVLVVLLCFFLCAPSAFATRIMVPDHDWTVRIFNHTYGLQAYGSRTVVVWPGHFISIDVPFHWVVAAISLLGLGGIAVVGYFAARGSRPEERR
jgi:hypothetical protein